MTTRRSIFSSIAGFFVGRKVAEQPKFIGTFSPSAHADGWPVLQTRDEIRRMSRTRADLERNLAEDWSDVWEDRSASDYTVGPHKIISHLPEHKGAPWNHA